MNFVWFLLRKRESVGNKVGLENGVQTDILIDCDCILVWHQVMCNAEQKSKLHNRVVESW